MPPAGAFRVPFTTARRASVRIQTMSGFSKRLWLSGAVAFIAFGLAEMETAGAGGRYSNFGPWDHRRVSAVSATSRAGEAGVPEEDARNQQAPHKKRQDPAPAQ
jgi:hypothetical protein